MVLTALQQICHDMGLTTMRPVEGRNGKTGRGDLVIKDANLGGNRQIVNMNRFEQSLHVCVSRQQGKGAT